ncbi:unnamed protein product [Trichobilharzia szidati]|nr:unnamed protein product [Trichobilharzia szidati]
MSGESALNVNSTSTCMYQSSDPHLFWHEGCDEATENTEFAATWSSGYQRHSLSNLKSSVISPDEVETKALHLRIQVMNNQTKF